MRKLYQIKKYGVDILFQMIRVEPIIRHPLHPAYKQSIYRVCVECGFRSEGIRHLIPITNGTYQTRNSRIENTYIILV